MAVREVWEKEEVYFREREDPQQKQKLDEIKRNFWYGKYITGPDFLEITKRDKFKIHPRTKRRLKNRVTALNNRGNILYKIIPGKRTPEFIGCVLVVYDYVKFLNI